jgi:hypothetical protein
MVTGNEPAFPGKMWGQQEYTGMTLRQLVLKDFMCSIIQGFWASPLPVSKNVTKDRITKEAVEWTDVYFKQLNKTNDEINTVHPDHDA